MYGDTGREVFQLQRRVLFSLAHQLAKPAQQGDPKLQGRL